MTWHLKVKSFQFRIITLVLIAISFSFFISGGFIIFTRLLPIEKQSVSTAKADSDSYAFLTEELLDSIGKQTILLSVVSNRLSIEQLNEAIVETLKNNPIAQSIYVIDKKGRVITVLSKEPLSDERREEFIGNDLSSFSLFLSSIASDHEVWSDKYISPITKTSAIGVAHSYNERSVIIEVSLSQILLNLSKKEKMFLAETWIFDQYGNLLGDTGTLKDHNILSFPILSYQDQILDNFNELPEVITINERRFYIGYAVSEKLKWIFFTRIPSDRISNPIIKVIITDIAIMTVLSMVLVILIVLILMKRMTNTVKALIQKARDVTNGISGIDWSPNTVNEFNELTDSLKIMAEKVQSREQRLEQLNEDLERRVLKRTEELRKRNTELAFIIEELKSTREELTRSENLAALGRMVAGVAHELNTPVGNSLLALSSMESQYRSFQKKVAAGLTESDLFNYMDEANTGLIIAQRNLEKTADLLMSFKQVANDQSSNMRRQFRLDQMLKELLQTLHPSFKRTKHVIETDLEPDITMNSFPGVLGQIVTNLINNALFHAWKEGEQGHLKIVTMQNRERVQIEISDDGHGIQEDIQKKIFSPFFTTKRGAGGTGLGLRIARNGAENILGGTLRFISTKEKGTAFILEIPAVAPEIQVLEED